MLYLLSDFESTGALKKVRSSLLIQFLVACYVVCSTYADLPNKPLIAHIVSPTKLSLLAPDPLLPANLPVFSRPYHEGLYANPISSLVKEHAQPPFYGPLITSAHTPLISSRMPRRVMKEAVVPHGAGLAPPDIAEISPTQSGDGIIPTGLTQPPLSPYTSRKRLLGCAHLELQEIPEESVNPCKNQPRPNKNFASH